MPIILMKPSWIFDEFTLQLKICSAWIDSGMYNYATPPGQNEPVWTNLTVQQVAAETILACTANGIPCTTQYGFLHKSGTPSRTQWYVVLQNVPADLTVQRVANLGCSHCAHLSSVTDKQPPVKKWAGMHKKLSLSSDAHIVFLCLTFFAWELWQVPNLGGWKNFCIFYSRNTNFQLPFWDAVQNLEYI